MFTFIDFFFMLGGALAGVVLGSLLVLTGLIWLAGSGGIQRRHARWFRQKGTKPAQRACPRTE